MYHRSRQSQPKRYSFGNRSNYHQNQNRRQRIFDPSFVINKSLEENGYQNKELVIEREFVPVHSFTDFPIASELKRNITAIGYTKPTPIQDQIIPHILAGKDVVGIANTGTGKTAAFLIPLINHAFLDRFQKVLIITPTRELAVQIRDDLSGLAAGMSINSVLCIGGVSIGPQIQRLRRNPQFVIGTPGRLKDLEGTRNINFGSFNNIVLDEVDRMLDIGFVLEIKHIVSCLAQKRHSLFFSATVPASVQDIIRSFLTNPITVSVKSTDSVDSIHQNVVKTNGKPKIEVLHDLLIKKEFSKVLVFGRTKHGMEKLSRDLNLRGFKVAAIHGNKSQNQRQRALNDFKNNLVQILLATDIASRGLDIDDVSHVINYDLPESYESYIHRIGRTGRANKSGTALTFVD